MIKKGCEEYVISYTYCGSDYSVKLSEASVAQLKILKGIVPEYFEKDKPSTDK